MYCILLYIAAQLQGAAGSWGGATTSTSFDVKKKMLVIATFTLSSNSQVSFRVKWNRWDSLCPVQTRILWTRCEAKYFSVFSVFKIKMMTMACKKSRLEWKQNRGLFKTVYQINLLNFKGVLWIYNFQLQYMTPLSHSIVVLSYFVKTIQSIFQKSAR